MGVYTSRYEGAEIDEKLSKVDEPFTSFEKNKLSRLTYENRTVYVDWATGNDDYDGSESKPFGTIQKAIDEKAETIYVAPGQYNEGLLIENCNNVTILLNKKIEAERASIVIGGDETAYSSFSAVTIKNSSNIMMCDIIAEYIGADCFIINDSTNIIFKNCAATDNDGYLKNGFAIRRSNVTMEKCFATYLKGDGFLVKDDSTATLKKCNAYNCDNGVTYTNYSEGFILGGEFCNCDTSGINGPLEASNLTVVAAISHDNAYGIALGSSENVVMSNLKSFNNLFINNETADIKSVESEILLLGTVYNIKDIDDNSIFNEYGTGGNTEEIEKALDDINGEVV